MVSGHCVLYNTVVRSFTDGSGYGIRAFFQLVYLQLDSRGEYQGSINIIIINMMLITLHQYHGSDRNMLVYLFVLHRKSEKFDLDPLNCTRSWFASLSASIKYCSNSWYVKVSLFRHVFLNFRGLFAP